MAETSALRKKLCVCLWEYSTLYFESMSSHVLALGIYDLVGLEKSAMEQWTDVQVEVVESRLPSFIDKNNLSSH